MKLLQYLLDELCAPACDGNVPDFLIVFDSASWAGLNETEQEALVFHELCHLYQKETGDGAPAEDKEGRPLLALRFHDYEFFDTEVRRYGPETCRLVSAALAIADGHRQAQERGRQLRRAAS